MVLDDVVDIGLNIERSAWLLAVVGCLLLYSFVVAKREPTASQGEGLAEPAHVPSGTSPQPRQK